MKRSPREQWMCLKRIFTVFKWTECFVCLKEFRREYGFEIKAHSRWGAIHTLGLCNRCAPSKEDAIRIIRNNWSNVKIEY